MSEGKMNYERERAQREYEERVRRHAAELHDRERERFWRLFALAGGLMVMQRMIPADALDHALTLERFCMEEVANLSKDNPA